MHEGSLKCFEWVLNDINQNTEVGVLFFVLWWWGGGVQIQHVTLTAGWRCEGGTGGAFDSLMHRLWLFSCAHSPP